MANADHCGSFASTWLVGSTACSSEQPRQTERSWVSRAPLHLLNGIYRRHRRHIQAQVSAATHEQAIQCIDKAWLLPDRLPFPLCLRLPQHRYAVPLETDLHTSETAIPLLICEFLVKPPRLALVSLNTRATPLQSSIYIEQRRAPEVATEFEVNAVLRNRRNAWTRLVIGRRLRRNLI